MQEYLAMMRHVRENGAQKGDRTGTGTLSVFGYQMRFDLSQGSIQGRIHEGPCMADRHAVSCSIFSARPAGIYEPAVYPMPGNFLTKQFRIN